MLIESAHWTTGERFISIRVHRYLDEILHSLIISKYRNGVRELEEKRLDNPEIIKECAFGIKREHLL